MRPSLTALVALGAAVVAPSIAEYRSAVEYRRRAGFPARRPYRGRIASFLARHLAGAPEPDRAAARAVATRVVRPADTDGPLSVLERPAAPASTPAAEAPTSSGPPDGPA